MTQMRSQLSIDCTQGICLMTLRRPQCLNALDTRLRAEVADALNAASNNSSIKVVILTGAGERGFCAGQDLRESAALDGSDGPVWMHSWTNYFDALSSCEKPIIAAVNGVAA